MNLCNSDSLPCDVKCAVSWSFIKKHWVVIGCHSHQDGVVVSLTYSLYLFSLYYLKLNSSFFASVTFIILTCEEVFASNLTITETRLYCACQSKIKELIFSLFQPSCLLVTYNCRNINTNTNCGCFIGRFKAS